MVIKIGDKINHWTVISDSFAKRVPSNQIKRYYSCKCICGTIRDIYNGSLKFNKSKSCGCVRANKKDIGIAASHNVYLRYKSRAKRKELAFDISEEELLSITKKDCYYCGKSDSNYCVNHKMNGGYRYNGVDRIDSSLGYTLDNCVPCCVNCNKAKLDQTHDEFLKMIELIYNKHIRQFSDFKE